METQKLSVKAAMFAGGILWGAVLLLTGLLNLKFPGYGQAFLEAMGSVYLWSPSASSINSVLILGAIAFLDGAVFGLLFSLIYNLCAGCCKKKSE